MQEIIVIAAMSENRVIGKDNVMPWSLREDLAHFKNLTKGWPCVMGRKTWESLPKKPLPGRLNIIVSKTMPEDSSVPNEADVKIFPSLSCAIEYCNGYKKVFICGGETIYRQALALANKIELTMIYDHYEGDAFFPEIDPACWTPVNTVDFDTFSFITYNRINKIKDN